MTMLTVAIHQPQYLPYPGLFDKIKGCDLFVVLDNVQFQKNGLQNRNRIKSSQGPSWLTVPIRHRFGQLINEVEIDSNVGWQKKHVTSLTTCYSGSEHFATHGPGLTEVLTEAWTSLADLNDALLRWAMAALALDRPIVTASELAVDGSSTDLLISVCRQVGATRYLSGSGGRKYMDLGAFEEAGIDVAWQCYAPRNYPQRFPKVGFVENLSVVDAIFNLGPAAQDLLTGAHT
jgi:hypothetical protein